MKIVKMHEGSREAFDDFLEQRLNELEIDNDMADKYFANMHLPVPVIPVQPTSFFAQHKNKLWLLVLLFSVSIISFLVVNKNINSNNETTLKEAIIENKASTNKNDVVKNKTTVEQAEKVKEANGNINLSNIVTVIKNNSNKLSYESKNDVALNNNESFKKENKANNNILKEKKTIVLDTKNQLDKDFNKDSIGLNAKQQFKNMGEEALDKLKNTTTLKNQKVDTKVEIKKSDSLYIVW
jgi:hypothetical protein